MFRKGIHITFCIVLILLSVSAIAQQRHTLQYEQSSSSTGVVRFELGAWRLRSLNSDGVVYQTIDMQATAVTERQGWAELPYINACIQLDANTQVSARIVECDYDEIQLQHPMLPSRGVIYRSQNPDSIPYRIATESMLSTQYPESSYELGDPFFFRKERGVNLRIYPFCYNAKQQILRIYRRMVVEIVQTPSKSVSRRVFKDKTTAQENGMYKSMFMNYNAVPATRALPVNRQYGDILVISTSRDSAAIMPYVLWKREKGFSVKLMIVARGTDVSEIIKNAYNSNENLMFVQLVGDWEDIKGKTFGKDVPADPYNGCVEGGDIYPDIAIGRFSCSNADECTVQVDKTIAYERNPDNSNWYSSAIGIASYEGGSNGDDGESDRTHIDHIWKHKLQPDGYMQYYEFYDRHSPQMSVTYVQAAVEQGASVINYAGHGKSSGFVTTGLSTNDLAKFTNGSKLPIIFATACYVGDFYHQTCFAERWLRLKNGGAIATFMSSIEQPWAPPMRGQDYFNDLLTGGYDYSVNPGNGTSTDERRTLLGNIHVNGIALMLKDYGGSDRGTGRTWNLFGDASLQVRTAKPDSLECSEHVIWSGIQFQATFTTKGRPVANAQVCVSQNGRYISGFTDANGDIVLNTVDLVEGKALLVATAFNTTTIYQEVDVRPYESAYIRAIHISLNHEGVLVPGRDAQAMLLLKNIGRKASTPATVSIVSQSGDVQVSNTVPIVALDPDQQIEVGPFSIMPNIAIDDEQFVPLRVVVTPNNDVPWTSSLTLTAHKPRLRYIKATWDELLGESSKINVRVDVANNGTYKAENVRVALSTASPLVLSITQPQIIPMLGSNERSTVSFEVELVDGVTADDVIPIDVSIESGPHVSSGSFVLSNTCLVEFTLYGHSEYKDGWFGNYLRISAPNLPDTTLTLPDGYTCTYTLPLPKGVPIRAMYCDVGQHAGDNSYTITYKDGLQIAHINNRNVINSQLTFICLCSCNADNPVPPEDIRVRLEHSPTTDLYTAFIEWDNVDPTALYNLYCNGKLLAANLTDSEYIYSGMLAEESYSISVSTVTCRGESLRSTPMLVSTKECRAPSNFGYEYKFISARDLHIVRLTWNISSATNLKYSLFRNDTLIANEIRGSEYRDTVYVGSMVYKVRANCEGGKTPFSDDLQITVRPCSKPQNATAEAVYSSKHQRTVVQINWQGEPNQVYRVLRSSVVIAKGISDTQFVDTTAEVGSSYKYKIQAQCGTIETNVELYTINSISSNTVEITVHQQFPSDSTQTGVAQHYNFKPKVYPNPAQSQFWIESEIPIDGADLYNMLGEHVQSIRFAPAQRQSVNLKGLQTGIYLLRLRTDNGYSYCTRMAVE